MNVEPLKWVGSLNLKKTNNLKNKRAKKRKILTEDNTKTQLVENRNPPKNLIRNITTPTPALTGLKGNVSMVSNALTDII